MPSLESVCGPVVKICGLTRLQDLVAAHELGAWALGFVFAPSPRRLEPGAARALLEAAGLSRASGVPADGSSRCGGCDGDDAEVRTDRPLIVGVFTDAAVDEMVSVVREVGLDAVQLHGLAGPSASEVADALGGRDREVLIIRALPVDVDESDAERLREAIAQARDEADIVLLDTRVAQRGWHATAAEGCFGGSGTSFCWDLASEAAGAAGQARLLVAGGIGPDNVLEALSASGAWGVDVSSGVESSPGIKDKELMEQLIGRVREGR